MNTCVKEKKKKENKARVSEFVQLSKLYFHFFLKKELFNDRYELICLLNISHWCVCAVIMTISFEGE